MAIPAEIDLDDSVMELSNVGKTVDCLSFAYLRLDCVGKNISSVSKIEAYEHLQMIDLSNNVITDVTAIAGLEFVLKLTLAGNMISSLACWDAQALRHLLHLDLSGNVLTALPQLHMPALLTASFARNQISTLKDFGGHANLRTLDLSEQKGGCLQTLKGLQNMPMLESLNVSKNSVEAVPAEEPGDDDEATGGTPAMGISSMHCVQNLPRLKTLDISKNIFETLEGPWAEMPSLERLIASDNVIASLDGVKSISTMQKLKELTLIGNPVEGELAEKIRVESLIFKPGLTKINDEDVQDEEREEAKTTHENRLEEERKRIEEEEEAARQAAEEAAAAAAAAADEEG